MAKLKDPNKPKKMKRKRQERKARQNGGKPHAQNSVFSAFVGKPARTGTLYART